ncbi:hypothetical protein SASPL_113128 [Salvia splendens]|uniref:Uncharacterized protein n=1 Tax=Salvia splendens TaxID=180675 RepID=A0A8X8Y3G4_SALSN|nr:hypothetical protein SASPL_113128 [Salvia splendens]
MDASKISFFHLLCDCCQGEIDGKKCKKLDCPLKLRCNSAQSIKTHWKKTHGVESNSDKDFCEHCGNYKHGDDPCNTHVQGRRSRRMSIS